MPLICLVLFSFLFPNFSTTKSVMNWFSRNFQKFFATYHRNYSILKSKNYIASSLGLTLTNYGVHFRRVEEQGQSIWNLYPLFYLENVQSLFKGPLKAENLWYFCDILNAYITFIITSSVINPLSCLHLVFIQGTIHVTFHEVRTVTWFIASILIYHSYQREELEWIVIMEQNFW